MVLRALDPDVAVGGAHEVGHEGESDPQPFPAPAGMVRDLVGAVEDARQFLFGDAEPGIGDGELEEAG